MVHMKPVLAVLGTAFLSFALTFAANDWGLATFGLTAWVAVCFAFGAFVGLGAVGLVVATER